MHLSTLYSNKVNNKKFKQFVEEIAGIHEQPLIGIHQILNII